MHTETTDNNKEWVFYDGNCALCRDWAHRLEGGLQQQGVGIAPLQTEWAAKFIVPVNNRSADRLPLREQAFRAPEEMKVLTSNGALLGGADALIYLAKYFWWGWGVRLAAQVPGVRFALRRAYAWLAKNRHCIGRRCGI